METLRMLAQQVERQRQLAVLEDSVSRQIMDIQDKVRQMKADWHAEEADVERLKKNSLTAIFYEIIGKKAEKLEKEQQEALAAAARYQTAQAELDGLWRERDRLREERLQLSGCEKRFEAAKAARAEELKAAGSGTGGRVLELETELGRIVNQRRELREAMDAGLLALTTTRQVQEELDKAESWGTWDLLGGGGLITQMAKHDHLDSAQSLIHRLQNQLRQFKTELADVEVHAELHIQIDEFLRFADWFFDGLIVDWTVQEKIEQAKEDVYNVTWQIQSFLNRLEQLETDLLRREDQAKEELEKIVMEHAES